MDIIKDKCVNYFISKRIVLDDEERFESKKRELLQNDLDKGSEVGVNIDKYNNMIIFGVIIYMILAFTLTR